VPKKEGDILKDGRKPSFSLEIDSAEPQSRVLARANAVFVVSDWLFMGWVLAALVVVWWVVVHGAASL